MHQQQQLAASNLESHEQRYAYQLSYLGSEREQKQVSVLAHMENEAEGLCFGCIGENKDQAGNRFIEPGFIVIPLTT